MSDLNELFSRDPLKITRPDRRIIIEKFREDRARFLLGQKAPKEKKEKVVIDLDSMEL